MFTIIGIFTMEVLAIGEALIDLLSNECINENTSNQSFSFNQFAGGAPANVAVAVAKLGGKSALLGKVGDDKFGHFLINALKSHNVNTDHLGLSLRGKTAIAFVSLDKSGERTFEFYDKSAAHYDLHITDLDPTLFTQPKIVSFCLTTSRHFSSPLFNCFMASLIEFSGWMNKCFIRFKILFFFLLD